VTTETQEEETILHTRPNGKAPVEVDQAIILL
jgi:hypothetical protein